MPSQLIFLKFLHVFHLDKIQVPVHFLQYLTDFIRIEFSHEEISQRVLALMLNGVYPTTLVIKCASCQLKNGIVINLLRHQIHFILGESCLVLKFLFPSFFHKSNSNCAPPS
jgi:hypothetical protein